jgi:hypothetical protein
MDRCNYAMYVQTLTSVYCRDCTFGFASIASNDANIDTIFYSSLSLFYSDFIPWMLQRCIMLGFGFFDATKYLHIKTKETL